ncbi:ATP-binding protein [[Clostridium] leptum]|nr:ATP-binding protein [[Clostridium] leptum]
MAILHSNVLCPYCLSELRDKDVKFVCPMCGTEVVPSKMDVMLKKIPKCKNAGCHNTLASDRTCSHCNASLPPDILDYSKYLRFSILGITGAGKTNFLTAMLHELRHTSGSPLVIAPMDNNTSTIFQDNVRAMYDQRQPVPATPPGTPPQPQQWRIRDRSKMSDKKIASYSMTIFDGAGEDCENINPVISRYISQSKVLVVLIDPLSLPGVCNSISPDVLRWSTTAQHDMDASANMVDGLADYIRQSCGLRPGALIDRDVAVVFTKMDAVKDSFGSATVTQPSPHLNRKGFVKADSDAVDAEIKDWLEAQGESTFLAAIDTNFRQGRVRFFGVSSFGQPPTGDNQLSKIIPHRVLDPLMWMLSKEGIIPVLS